MGDRKISELKKHIIVIGGGAAGCFAAGTALKGGSKVTIIDKNKRLARKVMITGKGRCNVTNNCDINTFISSVPTNGRFLYSALNELSPQKTMQVFEDLGVKLKTERGNRVFPSSDKAHDVVDALVKYANQGGSKDFKLINASVKELVIAEGLCKGVVLDSGAKLLADGVIVATGGKSYPLTGSTGDGYRLAIQAGHTVTKITPSLVPLESSASWCMELQGLALKNINLKIYDRNKRKYIFDDFGEMLFTHFGISGPLVLSASSHIPFFEKEDADRYFAEIDLKPALTVEKLNARILRDIEENKNTLVSNLIRGLVPASLSPVVYELLSFPKGLECNSFTKKDRNALVELLKSLKLDISGFRPIDEAVITSGGVSVKEISSQTMKSKLVEGLSFAGEVIDVDAYTGGFNLQIAFSTGMLAGRHVC